MKTCFISRFGGVGDLLHCAHLPELIKSAYGVTHLTLETNYNGMIVFDHNPFVDTLIEIDIEKATDNRLRKNWDYCEENFDLFFNLIDTIELKYCLQEHDSRYYRNDEYRRKNFGNISYYDVMTKAVGLSGSYLGTRGKLYYPEEDHKSASEWVREVKEKQGVDKVILVNLSGSSLHKKFVQAESVCRKILAKYANSVVILTGDKNCEEQVFTGDRIMSKVNLWNYRTAALMTKYVDLTISVESGIPLIAHSWDAPCLHLLTAASPDNHVKYARNAYYLQSPVPCSPCHKNPQNYWGCPTKDSMPACVWFYEDDIIDKVEEALERS